MKELMLFTTAHCHLCEQAEAVLAALKAQHDINWHSIEISNDEQLIDQYGIRIPVIKCINNQTELNWPFTGSDILKLVKT